MNKEKQIEEMANIIAQDCGSCDVCMALGSTTDGVDCTNYYAARQLYNAGYRKSTEVAEEIFAEIDAHFDKRIALYQTMKSRALLVGNEVEREYADTMIINLTIYKKEVAELKKKYTEDGE